MLPLLSLGQWSLVYNALSFGIAAMGASTTFFFLRMPSVKEQYKTALAMAGIVTFIAFYHYLRIFQSWTEAFAFDEGKLVKTGNPFNDAYRYMDWLLTVPLLLLELIFVIDFDTTEEQVSKGISLALSSAAMICLGYPGEISMDASRRWMFWALAMVPFVFIVYTLFVGLSASLEKQHPSVVGLINMARVVTVLSWCTYPIIFTFPMMGVSGAAAVTGVQLGYTVADVISKCGVGLLTYKIVIEKSRIHNESLSVPLTA